MEIIVIKDRCLLRDGITNVLEREYKDSSVRAYRYKDCRELLERKTLANLLIVDIDTAEKEVSALIELHKDYGKKVIVWTANPDIKRLNDWFQKGFDGYFYNGMQPEELITGVNSVLENNSYVHPKLSKILLRDYQKLSNKITEKPVGVLTEREWNVLELLTKGFSNDKIAQFLFITEKTVKNHVSSIFRKLDVSDRTNAVLYALRQRWFYL
ncbi:response regulator transcription factor [Sediminibacillus albus]|uniref:Two-component system, NarL family, response regulator DegU n=1 Tax=Sediminibacillus albus TaxID=407036 RepID=A0A1G8YCQ4_9BACI|nr:response regulator transcription factor [Sediminibacillus albus]SDK00015.1 two-component system, NarL family, response regulator DegU [Sediminibacillus albus]